MNESPSANNRQDMMTQQRAPGRVARAAVGLVVGSLSALVAVWLYIWLADEVLESETQRFDSQAVLFFLHHVSHPVFVAMSDITWIASGASQTVLALLVAALFWARRRLWPDGFTMLLGAFGGMLLDEGLKRIIHRTRPEPIFYHLGYSFPSGHAFSAVVVYGLIAYFVWRTTTGRWRHLVWVAALIAMLLVGFSRVYLGQHYPTDVIGGYLAGFCWLLACIGWQEAMSHRAPRDPPAAATDHQTHD